MKATEKHLSPKSEIFRHTPSEIAESQYFLVQSVGHYYYEPGYQLTRRPVQNFLLIYVLQGTLTIRFNEQTRTAERNQFVLLDCRKQLLLSADQPAESLWIQFYGQNSLELSRQILQRMDFVFSMDDPFPIIGKISRIFEILKHDHLTHDITISRYIYDIICDLTQFSEVLDHPFQRSPSIESVITYIDEHFKEDPSIQTLSKISMISPYHLIRLFQKETGMTPHEYVLNLKIRTAKYMLRKTRQSIREVCFDAGFRNESAFSTTFKRMTGMTPSQFRKKEQGT